METRHTQTPLTRHNAKHPPNSGLSQIARCIRRAGHYHLSAQQAREVIDNLIALIHADWNEVCNLAAMPAADRQRLWGRQFLNPYSL